MDKQCESLSRLERIIDTLSGEDGCPWDKEQTPLSLADYIIEESHELVAAIRSGEIKDICEELGDVFFLLLFISHLYASQFKLEDALDRVCEKMIRRHPHVFAGEKFSDRAEQLQAWEKIKKGEHEDGSIFASLPASLPPLIKAYRIHSKAARAGFTWLSTEEVERQVEAEWLEWLDACMEENEIAKRHELGDMIFSLVELGRRHGIKANEALDFACRRFLCRFKYMEDEAKAQGKDIAEMSLLEQDELWTKAKEAEV